MNEHQLLLHAIEQQEPFYNPDMRAITAPFSSPGYHTTLAADCGNVHSTRTAAHYALALLDSGLERYRNRAWAVLERLTAAQDNNPESPSFGIWSWFYEEPIEQMSPPDHNWADFIGKPLTLALKRHGHLMPCQLREDVTQAVRNACMAIIKRNVGPSYTNIAIMGAFVTLVAGDWLGDKEIEAYGLKRLQRFYNYTKEIGTFQEFNSPTYTSVAIEELSSIRTETGDIYARKLADELLDFSWSMTAERYHPGTGQWSGPHGRAYGCLLGVNEMSFFQLALNGKVRFLSDEDVTYHTMWYRNEIRCPDAYVHQFTEPRITDLNQQIPSEGTNTPCLAVTYGTEDYTLSSFSRSDLWNQRRSLLAYAATPKGPIYMHLRALHDHYDFSAAMIITAQSKNHSLFGITFATDGGDRHIHLDPIREGAISAKDLRIRFEFGGEVDAIHAEWEQEDASAVVLSASMGEWPLRVRIAAAEFSGQQVRFEINRVDGVVQADMILYSGDTRKIELDKQEQAFVAGQLALDATLLPMETTRENEVYSLRTIGVPESSVKTMHIGVPVRPNIKQQLAAISSTEVDTVNYLER